MDNRWVLLSSSALKWMNDILSVQRREKGSKTKSLVRCPKIVKLCNSGMAGVDLMDQRTAAYHLDWKSSVRFYHRIFFDLVDIACFNSYSFITWSILTSCLSLITRLLSQKNLIQYHQGRKRAVPVTKRCENDTCTVPWGVKKVEHSSYVWLISFHYA